MNMRSWHVVQEAIVKSKNRIVHVKDEIVTLFFSSSFVTPAHIIVDQDGGTTFS